MDAGRPQGRDVIGSYLDTVGTITSSEAEEISGGGVPDEEGPSGPQQSGVSGEERAGAMASAVGGPAGEAGDSGETEDPGAGGHGASMNRVLTRLSAVERMPLTELTADLRTPMLEAAVLLAKLRESGLVRIDGHPGQETVALTEAGRTVAELSAS